MASPLRDFGLTKPDGTLKSPEELQEDANRLVGAAGVHTDPFRVGLAGDFTQHGAEATSQNQAATVSVTATGGLQAVWLDDRISTMGPSTIADSIMEAYREATTQAAGG